MTLRFLSNMCLQCCVYYILCVQLRQMCDIVLLMQRLQNLASKTGVCMSDRQRRVRVPSGQCDTQETHRVHVVRRRRVRMSTV